MSKDFQPPKGRFSGDKPKSRSGPSTGSRTGSRTGPKGGGRKPFSKNADTRDDTDVRGEGPRSRNPSKPQRPQRPGSPLSGPPRSGSGPDRRSGEDRAERPHGQRERGERPPRDRGSDGRPQDDGPKTFSDTPRGIAVRRAACDLLEQVRGGLAFDDALSQCRSYMALGTPETQGGDSRQDYGRADRGFARAMASTALRRRGTIDHLIGPYLDRPLPAKATRVMDILRISAAQSLFLETPDHAAVSLATDLSKERRETGGYAALVNAIARKVAKSGGDKLPDLPVRLDTPAWLWRQWERAYGPAISRKIAAAHRHPAPLDITLKDAATRAHWMETLGATALAPEQFPASLRLNTVPRDVTQLPGFADGAWWVQDFSAHIPVASLGDITGKSVLDLCAAPGGKTLQLAAAGAAVTAIDRQATRMEKVEHNLARTGLSAQRYVADALDFTAAEPFDIVLLDAPCTATGTIRRHPDIPWAKSADDVASMARVQQRLIDQALTLVKPGGMLVYCTCSLQAEEGEDQIKSALTRHSQISRQAIEKSVFSKEIGTAINRHGEVRLLPFMAGENGGVDGFFCAHLVRA